jgi:hypothetical protein
MTMATAQGKVGACHRAARYQRMATRRRVVLALTAFTNLLLAGCSSGLPRPPLTQVATEDYVEVSSAPRMPPVEFVPPKPHPDAVWVDGTWEWVGGRYAWRFGTWLVPPKGARYARWVIVRRIADGKLFFARSSWKDSAGQPIEDRTFSRALGPRARARSRAGAGEPVGGPEQIIPEPEHTPEPRERESPKGQDDKPDKPALPPGSEPE